MSSDRVSVLVDVDGGAGLAWPSWSESMPYDAAYRVNRHCELSGKESLAQSVFLVSRCSTPVPSLSSSVNCSSLSLVGVVVAQVTVEVHVCQVADLQTEVIWDLMRDLGRSWACRPRAQSM